MSESRKKRFGEWVCLGSAFRRRDRFWVELFAAWFSNKADNGRQPSHTSIRRPVYPISGAGAVQPGAYQGFRA